MKKQLKFGSMLLAAVLVISSCNKNEAEDMETSEDVLKMDMEEADISQEEIYLSTGCALDWSSLISSCAVITESSPDFPKTVTIDYGTGCQDAKGRTKKGKIILELSDDIRTTGATRHVTFENFYINDVNITGTRDAVNTGVNTSGNMVISITGDIKATLNGAVRSRTFQREREWISGAATCTADDDEFSITGSGTIVTRKGRSIAHKIVEPVHIKPVQCKYPLSGTVDIGTAKRGAILDFGNGECDDEATLTTKKRNKKYNVNLETRMISK